MSENRSPTKQTLRGMLVRRSMTKPDPKPKKLKRTKTAKSRSAQLLRVLQDAFSESSLSEGDSTGSSEPF
nr:ORF3 [Torque teno felis virus]